MIDRCPARDMVDSGCQDCDDCFIVKPLVVNFLEAMCVQRENDHVCATDIYQALDAYRAAGRLPGDVPFYIHFFRTRVGRILRGMFRLDVFDGRVCYRGVGLKSKIIEVTTA